MRRLLDGFAEPNPNEADKFGNTVLRYAALKGHAEIAKMLLSAGANPNAANNDGITALLSAASKGHAEVAKVLLSAGANPNAATDDGWTALHWAAGFGHAEIAKMLLSAGANPNAANNYGATALYLANKRWLFRVVYRAINNLSYSEIPPPLVPGVFVYWAIKNWSDAETQEKAKEYREVVRLLKEAGAKE